MEAQTLQNRAEIGPRGVQDDQKIEKYHRPKKNGGGVPQGTPIWEEYVANMAPTWVPKWSQDGPKIVAKMYHFFDGSWHRFLGGFW